MIQPDPNTRETGIEASRHQGIEGAAPSRPRRALPLDPSAPCCLDAFDRHALAHRALIGVALAEAWREPCTVDGALITPSSDQLACLSEAWSAVAAQCVGCAMGELSLGELTPDRASIEPLITWLGADPLSRSAALEALFGLIISKDCPPYETEFCHWNDPTYRSSQMADVGGFYRAFGVEPRRDRPERQDHISLEIEFIAFLQQKLALALEANHEEHIAVCREALTAFVRDHASWWMPTFAGCVKRRLMLLRSLPEGAEVADLLDVLEGVTDLLRAWIAIVRLDCEVPPAREIIAPNVPEWRGDEEELCGTCDESAVCSSAAAEMAGAGPLAGQHLHPSAPVL